MITFFVFYYTISLSFSYHIFPYPTIRRFLIYFLSLTFYCVFVLYCCLLIDVDSLLLHSRETHSSLPSGLEKIDWNFLIERKDPSAQKVLAMEKIMTIHRTANKKILSERSLSTNERNNRWF